jgi:hypothetical protein
VSATMGSGAEVTMAVAGVGGVEALEVVSGSVIAAVAGEGAMVARAWIELAIHGTVEVMGTMEPRASAKEDAAVEPLGTIVAISSTVVGRIVIVAVGAFGRVADVDADGNLGVCLWGWEKGDSQCGCTCY